MMANMKENCYGLSIRASLLDMICQIKYTIHYMNSTKENWILDSCIQFTDYISYAVNQV